MARIKEFQLRDVRCFDGYHTVKCGKVTILLGNNSTGKSTFLGCYNTLARIADLVDLHNTNYFNLPPFDLGFFDTICRSGKPDFGVSAVFEDHCFSHVKFDFDTDKEGMPRERYCRLEFNGNPETRRAIDIELMDAQKCLEFRTSEFCFRLARPEISNLSISTWLSRYAQYGHLPFGGEPSEFRRRIHSSESDSDEIEFAKFLSFFRRDFISPKGQTLLVEALDPNEQEPRKRTYSSLPHYLDPACDANLASLGKIGKKLGLWEAISAQDSSKSGEFEVTVETQNGWTNLVDVGYGIHSLLPLAHSMQKNEPGTVFLLQQPEVHVHPSAQASLAQFMAESQYEFLIETHSEHFTDRFRICVMDGTLRPDELSIVYFDLSEDGKSAQIHNLRVDGDGNLLDVPNGFRSFFLRETKRLLGFQ